MHYARRKTLACLLVSSLYHGHTARLRRALLAFGLLIVALPLFAQSGQISGVVKDPQQASVAGAQVTVTNLATNAKTVVLTDNEGSYVVPSLPPGTYALEAQAKSFQPSEKAEIKIGAGETVRHDLVLSLESLNITVNVTAGGVENAYRVDTVKIGGPLGAAPILDVPYSVNVLSRQLIDDTQSRNFKETAKYLPLVSFQEMQGPEVLRPESRGMQGSNMQNDRKDGMGIAVTTPSAMEEYEQVEVITGLGGPLYGPANPSGIFNFVTKRPTNEPLTRIRTGLRRPKCGHGAYRSRRTLRPGQYFRLPYQYAPGRRNRLCQ